MLALLTFSIQINELAVLLRDVTVASNQRQGDWHSFC